MKLRMLFMDDRTKRLHAALEKYGEEYDLTLCCNVKECLRALAQNDYDIVSLDHDLNGCDFDDPDSENAGMEVVRYLEKTGWPEKKPKPFFIIHSSNIFAAHLMVTRLRALEMDVQWNRFEYPEKRFSGVSEVRQNMPVIENNGRSGA